MEAGPAPASLRGAAVLPEGGGTVPSASAGLDGQRPRGPRAGEEGGGTGGGVAQWLPASPLWGGRPLALCPVPTSSPAHPSQVYAFGPGHGAAPGAGCGLPPVGQPGRGGGEGRLVSRPPKRVCRGAVGPGGRSDPVRPSAFLGRATMPASLATPRSWGAPPPYCSGSLSRAAPGRGPCVVLVRWRGFARQSWPPREQAVGGVGAHGLRAQLRPPPGAAVRSGGGGTFPRPRGGWRAGTPVARRPGGGSGGERGGGARHGSLPPLPWGGGLWPLSQSPFFPGAPPLGIHVQSALPGSPGRRARLGPPLFGQPRGGGGGSLCRGLFPRLPRAGTKASRFVC